MKNLSCQPHLFPDEVEQGNALSPCFSLFCKQVSFCRLFSSMFFSFLCFLLVILLLKMAPKPSAEVLSSVPETVMCLMEKTCVLDKLRSGMSYSAVGCEFNIDESTYILN